MGNNIFKIFVDKECKNLFLAINLKAIIGFIIIGVIVLVIYKIRNRNVFKTIKPVEITLSFGGLAAKYQIVRNYSNLGIAHKIYIELITRKAAIKIDEENDVISEVYDSWYNLFQITRQELKNIPCELLNNNDSSEQLIQLATDVLNKELRLHLTKYQAKFRKWYKLELEKISNQNLSPQEIQKEFPEYKELITSMKEVNTTLIQYAEQLKNFIENK